MRKVVTTACALLCMAPGTAMARQAQPGDLGCPSTLDQVRAMAQSLTKSPEAPYGVFSGGKQYLGGPPILGIQTISMRVSATGPIQVGFKLSPAFASALQGIGSDCGDACDSVVLPGGDETVMKAQIRRWANPWTGGQVKPDGPEIELQCMYSAYSNAGFP